MSLWGLFWLSALIICIELLCWMIQNRMSPGWLKTHEKTLLIITFDAQLVCFALMFSARIWFLQNVVFPARQHLDLLFAARFNISFNVFAARLPVQPADCTLWLFCDKTELFRRGLCVRGQNIVFYLIFSAAGQVTSVNRELTVKTRSWTNQ